MSKWFENKNIRIAGIILSSIFVLAAVFYLGILVGVRAFRPLGRGPFSFLLFQAVGGHGAIGTVIRINGTLITMTDRSGQSQTVSVGNNTLIEVGHQRHKQLRDIHIGDHIVVLGEPQNNAIQARFIRVDTAVSTPAAPAPTRTPRAVLDRVYLENRRPIPEGQ